MAVTTIPWGDGSGDNIYLTYPSASGDQTVEVSSDANSGSARSKTITFTAGSLTKTMSVNQEAAVVAIPYIRGGADGSYIDTGITADNTVKVNIWARNFNPTCGFLFGSRIGTRNNNYGIGSHTGVNTGSIRLDYAQELSYVQDQFVNLSGFHKYEVYQGVIKVDDTAIGSITETSFSNAYSIHLLGMNTAGTHTAMTLPADICACKIYKNGTLVRDFTAVETPSVGLYDAVSGTLFTNAGNGSFTYGTFDQNAYTPLDYIGCSGSQYFDSGTYGTYAGGIVTKFMPTNITPKWTTLLGYRSSNNSCDISLGTTTAGQDNMKCYWRFGANNTSGQVFSGSSSNKLTDKAVIAVKSNSTLTLYYNNSQIGSNSKTGVSSSFRTTYPMCVGTLRTSESTFAAECFIGRIYYVGFGAGSSLVPAKQGSKVGMYDTYNDVFYPSATSTPFVAGAEL